MAESYEGMQRPRPGLLTAFVRSLFLVVPFTWFGLTRSGDLGLSPMAGVCVGFAAAVALSSTMISWWFWRHICGPDCAQTRTNTILRHGGEPLRLRLDRRDNAFTGSGIAAASTIGS